MEMTASEWRELKNYLQTLTGKLDNVETEIKSLRQTVKLLETKLQDAEMKADNQNLISRQKLSNAPIEKNFSPPFVNQNNLSRNNVSGIDGLVAEFNSIAKKIGYEKKIAEKNFLQRHNVRTFNCGNFEARMNEPVPPPQFIENDSANSGDYRAIHLGNNVFAVFPNIRQYTDNYHDSRAMGCVFDSNFKSGETYSEIIVERPAMFTLNGNSWILKKSGKLKLG